MIQEFSISRFKSIRSLKISCKKVNVFIGAPDTGKPYIIEALHFLSRLGWGWPIDSSLRLSSDLGLAALFYRQSFEEPIRIFFPPWGVTTAIKGQDPVLVIHCMASGQSARIRYGGHARF